MFKDDEIIFMLYLVNDTLYAEYIIVFRNILNNVVNSRILLLVKYYFNIYIYNSDLEKEKMTDLIKSSIDLSNDDYISRISLIGCDSVMDITELTNIISVIDIGLIPFNYNELSIMIFYLLYEVLYIYRYNYCFIETIHIFRSEYIIFRYN